MGNNRLLVEQNASTPRGDANNHTQVNIVNMSGAMLSKLELPPSELIFQVLGRLQIDNDMNGQLTYRESVLDSNESLQGCGVPDGAMLTLVLEKKPASKKPAYTPLRIDTDHDPWYDNGGDTYAFGGNITHFGAYSDSVGVAFLNGKVASVDDAHEVALALKAATNGSYESYPDVSALKCEDCKELMSMLNVQTTGEADFRINLSKQELTAVVGLTAVNRLLAFFGDDVDEIKLRRVEAHGLCVKFHVDSAQRTMQVPLNGEDEYEGGRLVYITARGLETVERPAGSVTIHDNTIAHGVTRMASGVRYGLFLAKSGAV